MPKRKEKIEKWKNMESDELLALYGELSRVYGGRGFTEPKIEKLELLRQDLLLLEDILKERLLRKPRKFKIIDYAKEK